LNAIFVDGASNVFVTFGFLDKIFCSLELFSDDSEIDYQQFFLAEYATNVVDKFVFGSVNEIFRVVD
jgi:hypothetical protein